MAKVLEIEKLPKLLESYIQSGNLNFLIGSAASLPAIKLAGGIENELDDLIQNNKVKEADLIALDFIQELESQNDLILNGAGDANTTITLDNYVSFLSAIDELLFERKNVLLPRQACVFTTNYDLFIEHASSRLPSLILIDGFDRTSSLGSDFRFAPELFLDRTYRSGSIYTRQAEVPTINLFKLHGSLNWRKLETEIVFRQGTPEKIKNSDRSKASKLDEALQQRALILPNLKKFGYTLMDRVYYDLLRFFANSLEKENAVLISFGFSFADKHILEITRRGLRNPTSQLIIFSYDEGSAADFNQKFSSQRNTLIISPKKGEHIDFQNFTGLLKSVTPSQKAINE